MAKANGEEDTESSVSQKCAALQRLGQIASICNINTVFLGYYGMWAVNVQKAGHRRSEPGLPLQYAFVEHTSILIPKLVVCLHH